MAKLTLPDAPDGSELGRWRTDGRRSDHVDRGIVCWFDPQLRYRLSVQQKDSIEGFLIQLRLNRGHDELGDPLGRTIVKNHDLIIQAAAQMATAAGELHELHKQERVERRQETIYRGDTEADAVTPEPPERFDGSAEQWADALHDAYVRADVSPSKATLGTETTDEQEYYCLVWREDDVVTSQRITPAHVSGEDSG